MVLGSEHEMDEKDGDEGEYDAGEHDLDRERPRKRRTVGKIGILHISRKQMRRVLGGN